MNTRKWIITSLAAAAVAWSITLPAQSATDEENAAQAAREARRAEYEALIEEAELRRQLAMEQAEEAELMARKQAEMELRNVEEQRAEREKLNQAQLQEREAQIRERELQIRELEKMREELSRTHRELRETSRQVAQAHRELAARVDPVHRVRHVNLGDRAVIGVILGRQTEEGVEIIGVSPDGPAERSGLQAGDVLVAIGGTDLSGTDGSGRKALYEVMDEVADGDEVAISVLRDGDALDFTVTAERREPLAWQSLIRIPDVPADVDDLDSSQVRIKQIVLPQIDREALAAKVAELEKEVEKMDFSFIEMREFEDLAGGNWEFEIDDMSEFGMHALREADVWFGLPQALGLELATINPDLGGYFETDRGVLVIRASQDNAYTLQSGDVVLEIDTTTVDTPADLMRALRELDSGDTVDILIKRNRRDVTLQVVVPEERLSFLSHGRDHR